MLAERKEKKKPTTTRGQIYDQYWENRMCANGLCKSFSICVPETSNQAYLRLIPCIFWVSLLCHVQGFKWYSSNLNLVFFPDSLKIDVTRVNTLVQSVLWVEQAEAITPSREPLWNLLLSLNGNEFISFRWSNFQSQAIDTCSGKSWWRLIKHLNACVMNVFVWWNHQSGQNHLLHLYWKEYIYCLQELKRHCISIAKIMLAE